jgi:1-acyl-sn-glycerol-3-phosphate acyltransferase
MGIGGARRVDVTVETATREVARDQHAQDLALELAHQFVSEIHAGGAPKRPLTLDSALAEDWGLDSLSRVELATRIEHAFGVDLPERELSSAATLRDLLAAMRSAPRTSPVRSTPAPPAHWAEPVPSVPETAATLIEVLDWHVQAHAGRTHIVHLAEGDPTDISYLELQRQSDAVAARLQQQGLARGGTVAIMLPTCPEYFHTFFGVLRAGGVPVPIYPPASMSQIEEHVKRHAGILENAGTTVLVTVPEVRGVARLLGTRVPGLRKVLTVAELMTCDDRPRPVPIRTEDIALIQYTSGSTGDPKGVVLTHANLLANIRAECQAIAVHPEDVFVSWLPLYHDMGLISVWLASLYAAAPLVVMSPLAFLARPERWLRAIQHYRGTIAAAPNFAYELCVKRIDETSSEGLDLRSWRLAANGAEPVLPQTLHRFTERFAGCGFRPEAMTPVYGLAECAVGLLCPPLNRGPRIDRVRREALSAAGRAEPATADDPDALEFACCGRPLPGHDIRIVDALGREAGERIEGRLQFRGPSATRGYYRNPQQNERLFDGDWLDTGDRAYTADGEVYLTGRVKDIIIRGGRNIYPHEVENAVGSLAGVRRGCVAVFGSPDSTTGTERLVVLAETRERDTHEQDDLRARILEVTMKVLGEPADEIVLVPPHTVLKTSSGKLRRAACRQLYEQGRVATSPHDALWQLVRLTAGSVGLQARHLAQAAGRLVYGLHAWLVFATLAPATWLRTALAASPAKAWQVNRSAARRMLRLAGISLSVNGLENLPRASCVLVANHASYLDGLALFAAIPRHFSLVAKREFLDHAFARLYLQGLGVRFVERHDPNESVEAARQLASSVAAGASLGFFAEGTFRRTSGLGPFRLGAFVAAVAGRVGVLPVAIRGTRAILRDGQWLPRRGAIEVTIGKLVLPLPGPTDDYAAAAALRDATRAEILGHCGEPDASEI